jgi:hypothetical protein
MRCHLPALRNAGEIADDGTFGTWNRDKRLRRPRLAAGVEHDAMALADKAPRCQLP